MSVIDEKGKLGGKINIIDLIVILVVLAAVAAVFVLGGRGGGGQPQHVVYTVEVQGVDEDVYKNIQTLLPCQLLSSEKLQNGYVTAIEGTKVPENDQARIDAYENVYFVGMRPGLAGSYDVVCTIEADISDTVNYKIGSQEIRVGRNHIVKTTAFELDSGIITSRQVVAPEG